MGLFKKPSTESLDLTTPEAVKRSQKVYDRIVSGQCKDARAELDAAHNTKSGKNRRR